MWRFDAILGFCITMLVSYGLDRWVQAVRVQGFSDFRFIPFYLASIVANLIVAILCLGLTWYVLFRGQKSILVAAVYLLAGLGFAFLPIILASTPGSFRIFDSPDFRFLRVMLLYSSPRSWLVMSGAFTSVIGLIGLLLHFQVSFRRLADFF